MSENEYAVKDLETLQYYRKPHLLACLEKAKTSKKQAPGVPEMEKRAQELDAELKALREQIHNKCNHPISRAVVTDYWTPSDYYDTSYYTTYATCSVCHKMLTDRITSND